jgi:hypothetical protein
MSHQPRVKCRAAVALGVGDALGSGAHSEVHMLRVVGAGLGRTGTMSLKLALERLLGAPCYHMVEVFSRPAHFEQWTRAAKGEVIDWNALFEGFGATVDWPSASFWPELARAYPDAIVLLSTRSPESWWKSASDTIFRGLKQPGDSPLHSMMSAILGTRFTLSLDDHDAAIAAFEAHNAKVRAAAPRGRLLEWSPKDGWAPLCNALGLPIPAEPFPHANSTDEFNARFGGGPPRV